MTGRAEGGQTFLPRAISCRLLFWPVVPSVVISESIDVYRFQLRIFASQLEKRFTPPVCLDDTTATEAWDFIGRMGSMTAPRNPMLRHAVIG